MSAFSYPRFAYRRSPDQVVRKPATHRLVIVGAGPVGLTLALDLAQRGIAVVILDEDDTVSMGSRGLCYAKRTLEIWDRLGVAEPILAKGVTWQRGKVFFGDRLAYDFDLLPEGGYRFPAFVNLQQYWMEKFLVDVAQAHPSIDLRWRHRVTGVTPQHDHVDMAIDTPDGTYTIQAEWLIACDGTRSQVRRSLGLDFIGQVFQDRFLIADVEFDMDWPTERRFWFDPPFHHGHSSLVHKQADGQWRVDFQLGWDADPELEKTPERIIPRLRGMFGTARDFTIHWASVYTFQCRRLEKFRHGRIIFAGDAAHQVSPFGARGANSGVQDADNLGWKLALVLAGEAPDALLDSYDAERVFAADENIRHATRSTDFISPKGAAALAYRDAVLELARDLPFARRLVNSGRLSTASIYSNSPLNTSDDHDWDGGVTPGAALPDAPVDSDWLLQRFQRGGFTLLNFTSHRPPPGASLPLITLPPTGLAAERFAAGDGTTILVRPDQHVAARWRDFDHDKIRRALRRALGHGSQR
jgi:3-(3-hydroxy-phenyl)propionate hydroxylase